VVVMRLGYNKDNNIICLNDGANQKLFEHCSDGMIAVTSDYFNETTRPLLGIHGIRKFVWEDNRGKNERLKAQPVDHTDTLKCKYCNFTTLRWSKSPKHNIDGSFEYRESGLKRLIDHCGVQHRDIFKQLTKMRFTKIV